MTEPLTVTTSPRDDRQLDLTIQMGAERTEEALHRAAKQVAKRANIPGFRRGKAPFAAVLRTFGREALLKEVLDEVGGEAYKEVLESEHIEPYGQADLVDVEMDPLTFKLRVPLQPIVDLNDYRSIRVEAPEVNVTEADVDEYIKQRREERATSQEVDRAAEMGDTIVMDIRGTVGEDTIMDNQDWELVLKEEGGWLPGFDQAFVGAKAGEEKTFTLRYPEESASRYKGQEASFQATVKQVKARVLPELNDEFAKSLGDQYENVEVLRAQLLAQLTQQRTTEAEARLNDAAITALIEKATLTYPPAVVAESLEQMLHDMEHRLADIGYKMEDYLRLQSMTLADYAAKMRPQAEEQAKARLVLGKLAEQEHITVSSEEVAGEVEKITGSAGERPAATQIRQLLSSEQGRLVVSQDLLNDKTLGRLRAIVTGQPVPSLDEEEQPGEEQAAGQAPETAETETAKGEGEPTVEASSEG